MKPEYDRKQGEHKDSHDDVKAAFPVDQAAYERDANQQDWCQNEFLPVVEAAEQFPGDDST